MQFVGLSEKSFSDIFIDKEGALCNVRIIDLFQYISVTVDSPEKSFSDTSTDKKGVTPGSKNLKHDFKCPNIRTRFYGHCHVGNFYLETESNGRH